MGLITHVETSIENGTFCFKFSVLHQMYENRLYDLGIDKEVNEGHFEQQVLEYFPNAQMMEYSFLSKGCNSCSKDLFRRVTIKKMH